MDNDLRSGEILRVSPLSRILYRSPLAFHPFLFCSQKRNGWSPKKKPPPISLCLIPVRRSGWPETRFAQTVGPEFPLLLTSIAPAGPARLRMGGELNGILKWIRRCVASGALVFCICRNAVPGVWDCFIRRHAVSGAGIGCDDGRTGAEVFFVMGVISTGVYGIEGAAGMW